MKKIVIAFLVISMLFLIGCSNYSTEDNDTTKSILTNKSGNIILPIADRHLSQDIKGLFSECRLDNFTILESLGKQYYGFRLSSGDEPDKYGFYEPQTNKFIEKKSVENEDGWVGTDSTVILDNRYYYEWRSYYTDEDAENRLYTVRLLQTDIQTKETKTIEKKESGTPLIYQCKINEDEFLTYSITQSESEKTDYAVISSAWIYNINGEKKEIIHERYENDDKWNNSEGILIERFFVSDGEIYGLGRKNISGKYKFFLYHYDKNGELIYEKIIQNFENIIGSEQFQELFVVNNYYVFRTYETLTTYICKITNESADLVMKGTDGKVQYSSSGAYILFIEGNVNPENGNIETNEHPIYIINTENNEICTVKFSPDLEKPYFIDFKSLSNGDIVISYCDNYEYNPSDIRQFILTKNNLYKVTEKVF